MSDDLISLHIAHLRAGGKSDHTIEKRRHVLRQLHQRLPFGLAYAAMEQLEAWLAELRLDGCSDSTIYTYHYHLTAFYRWATRAGYQDGDPSAAIAKPRQPKGIPNPCSEDELSRVLGLPEPIATAAVLAGFEGLRVSEIAACCREHITEELVMVPRGKGGKPATVPTHPFVWDWVRDRPDGPLVTNRRGQLVSGHWISVTARYHLNKVGMTEVHMHRLRHRFGTFVQRLSGDIRVTQECLRHSNIASTMGYTLITGSQRAAAVAALPVPGDGTPASL
jgi:integrase/recombinase XerD